MPFSQIITAFLTLLISARVAQGTEFHRLELKGSSLEYALILPGHFDKTKPYPVLLALPPGDQSERMVEAGLNLYWQAEAKRRGWVVVSPAATEGKSFY